MHKHLLAALPTLLLAGCMHAAGVVVGPRGNPVPTAVFSIGRPHDIAHYGDHHVDQNGRFDFYIFPPDATNVYVYDSLGDPSTTIRQVLREDINDHMRVVLQPSNLDMDPSLRAVPLDQ